MSSALIVWEDFIELFYSLKAFRHTKGVLSSNHRNIVIF